MTDDSRSPSVNIEHVYNGYIVEYRWFEDAAWKSKKSVFHTWGSVVRNLTSFFDTNLTELFLERGDEK